MIITILYCIVMGGIVAVLAALAWGQVGIEKAKARIRAMPMTPERRRKLKLICDAVGCRACGGEPGCSKIMRSHGTVAFANMVLRADRERRAKAADYA